MNFTTSCTGNCNQGRACTCLNQCEGLCTVRDGQAEMACYAPDPEPSLWARLWNWLKSPSFWA